MSRPDDTKADGVSRCGQLRAIRLDDVGPVEPAERTGCLICSGATEADETPISLAALLCDEHADAVTRRVAEAILRPIIPPDVHDAAVGDLLPQLTAWTPDTGGVYLHGPVGTGKSHQAAALTKRAWSHLRRSTKGDAMPNVAWRSVPIMMDEIAATFHSRAAYDMRAVSDAEVLVLDDMGLADNMPFAVRKLYALIEHRLQRRLCTIVTSNRDLDDLGRYLDAPQIPSRLAQMCAQVSFEGLPDRRPDLAPKLGES